MLQVFAHASLPLWPAIEQVLGKPAGSLEQLAPCIAQAPHGRGDRFVCGRFIIRREEADRCTRLPKAIDCLSIGNLGGRSLWRSRVQRRAPHFAAASRRNPRPRMEPCPRRLVSSLPTTCNQDGKVHGPSTDRWARRPSRSRLRESSLKYEPCRRLTRSACGSMSSCREVEGGRSRSFRQLVDYLVDLVHAVDPPAMSRLSILGTSSRTAHLQAISERVVEAAEGHVPWKGLRIFTAHSTLLQLPPRGPTIVNTQHDCRPF